MPDGAQYRRFQVGCPKNLECKTAKVSRDLNPPIESKLSRDNLDSIGGFKSRDTFAVLHSEFGRSKQREIYDIAKEPKHKLINKVRGRLPTK